MTKLKKTTTIYAPIDKLFDFIEDGANNLELYGVGMTQVKELSHSKERIGDILTLNYSTLGMRFEERLTYIEYKRPTLLVSKITGSMSGTFRISLEREADNQTMATLEVDYEIGSAIGRAANKLLLKRVNEKNLDLMLKKIKELVEAKNYEKPKEKAIALSHS